MNRLYKLLSALLLLCVALCGCANEETRLHSIVAEGSSEVSNLAGENYTVSYKAEGGVHHDLLTVEIFSGDERIARYSGNAGKLAVPEKIVKLCEDCYYYSGETDEGVIVGNSRVSDNDLPVTLREKINREELAERLEKCGYSSEGILACYDKADAE